MTTEEIRLYILNVSLELEHSTSLGLGFLLGIEKPSESYTLGNSSSALSFKTKIEMLIDIGAADKTTKIKFLKFMEIRNQFMHNLKADTFLSCVQHLDGTEGFLNKIYKPNKDLTKEEQIEFAIKALCEEVIQMKDAILLTAKTQMAEKHKAHLQSIGYQSISEVFRNPESAIQTALKGKLGYKKSYTERDIIYYFNSILKVLMKEVTAKWKSESEKFTTQSL